MTTDVINIKNSRNLVFVSNIKKRSLSYTEIEMAGRDHSLFVIDQVKPILFSFSY
ncbi:hypothetical protein BDF14DRAFT_1841776 [Spinellus fusiger]|nr:hypothetical protein BDF14DRAFT_1841776 [Spinellus fusiger]